MNNNNNTAGEGTQWAIMLALIRCSVANNPTDAVLHQIKRLQKMYLPEERRFTDIENILNPTDIAENFRIVQSTPSPEPARLTAEEVLDKYIYKGSQSKTGHASIKAMQQYSAQETARLRTLLKKVFDLEYDNLSWCEFEKQVLNAPPTDTPPLP